MYLHFSFDDVWINIKDLADHTAEYHSVFDNAFFGWMQKLHQTYGAVFSLYTFNRFSTVPDYHISCFPTCFAEELASHSDWLKFGFHAIDDQKKYGTDEPEQITADYLEFLDALLKGTNQHEESIDRIPRLGFCQGTRTNVLALRDLPLGIKGLLAADDSRLLYYFGDSETTEVIQKGEFRYDNLLFLRSQTRMESITCLKKTLTQIQSYTEPRIIELFSHESCWYHTERNTDGYNVRELAEYLIKWAYEAGYQFGFAQDLI